uniref:ribonuclease H n=1 Tax=Astyanax mexicanus TaxID=7994 RepID=A0A3B1JAJ5_ASTMX
MSDKLEFMSAQSIHCTANVHVGRDEQYEERWFKGGSKNETLHLGTLFWNNEFCACSVGLNEQQTGLYEVADAALHISLVKPQTATWQALGPWVKRLVRRSDWTVTEQPEVWYCSAVKVFKRNLNLTSSFSRSTSLSSQIDEPDTTVKSVQELLKLYPKLTEVPQTLWAKTKYDVGLIKNAEPVVITPKSSFRPRKAQYPLKPEALEGIKPVFHSLLKAGIIVPCNDSPVRTPQPDDWRFVQDLQAVNAAVVQRAPDVPNPYTILSQIPSNCKWFSVVDLANAFFSIPVHKDSQFWFAFKFGDRCFTFTRLCQGFCDAPTIFNQTLKNSLDSLVLSQNSAICCYVDDIILASTTQQQCEADTIKLLQHLAAEGHKASLSKLQFVKQSVRFLGHDISAEGKQLSVDRISVIQSLPKPVTKKQVMSFMGMCSYCRTFIPNYSLLEAPLREMTLSPGLTASSKVNWTPEAERAFVEIKLALQTTPVLGLPDPTKPFVQAVDERQGCMLSVLMQAHGDRLKPVAYFSAKLDPVAAGLPPCLRAVAAAEKAATASRDLVGYSPLTLLVPHAVTHLLSQHKTSHLSTQHWLKYNTVLLEMPNITVKRCSPLNPASLLPLDTDGEPHNCVALTNELCTPRPDLKDTPLHNPQLLLYVDGSASRDPETGRNRVGFAVVTDSETVVSGALPSNLSAQAAELKAVIEACKYATGKSVVIFSDSRYVFGVVHDYGAIWKQRNFLTSSGAHIAHHKLVSELLDAILLPAEIAVCKCEAHTKKTDSISLGNARADAAAKRAACNTVCSLPSLLCVKTPFLQVSEMQKRSSPSERAEWKKAGCTVKDGVWTCPGGRPCLPNCMFPYFAKLSHGQDHVSKGGMIAQVTKHWFMKGFSNYSQNFCKQCMICATHNVGRGLKMEQAAHPLPNGPFEHLQMDFIELTPSEGKKYCLVCVDMFSKYVNAYPTAKQDSAAVAKALLRDLIPRWGISQKISSDNGTPFVSTALKQIGQYLGIDMRQHCAYHPASGGAVERENGTLKNKLSKCCAKTGLGWTKVLPIVLMQMRMRERPKNQLSPFEILFGRPPRTGIGPIRGPVPDAAGCDDLMLSYCKNLSSALISVHQQVKAALPQPAGEPLHDLEPGKWVVVKDFRRNRWNKPRWTGPVQILLTTQTAVKVEGRATWIHASHCRRVPEPEETNP